MTIIDPANPTAALVGFIERGTTQKRLAALIRTARETGRTFDGAAVMEAATRRWGPDAFERVLNLSWKA